MLPLAALSLIVLLLTQMQLILQLNQVKIANAEQQWRIHSVARLADGLRQYTLEQGQPPVSLAVLATTPGFENLRFDIAAPWQNYATVNLTDAHWQYTRAVLYSVPASQQAGYPTTNSALNDNACKTSGNGSFIGDATWCGTPNYYWHLLETRELYDGQIDAERQAQTRLIRKFVNTYGSVKNNKQVFPKPDSGSSDTLGRLASIIPPTANTCSATYVWKGVPLDCADLFSIWGSNRRYEWLTEDRIAITALSPFNNASGQPVPVITVYDLDNMQKN